MVDDRPLCTLIQGPSYEYQASALSTPQTRCSDLRTRRLNHTVPAIAPPIVAPSISVKSRGGAAVSPEGKQAIAHSQRIIHPDGEGGRQGAGEPSEGTVDVAYPTPASTRTTVCTRVRMSGSSCDSRKPRSPFPQLACGSLTSSCRDACRTRRGLERLQRRIARSHSGEDVGERVQRARPRARRMRPRIKRTNTPGAFSHACGPLVRPSYETAPTSGHLTHACLCAAHSAVASTLPSGFSHPERLARKPGRLWGRSRGAGSVKQRCYSPSQPCPILGGAWVRITQSSARILRPTPRIARLLDWDQ